MICGLSLESSIDNLAVTFLATIQALAYGTRHIVQELLRYAFITGLVAHYYPHQYKSAMHEIIHNTFCLIIFRNGHNIRVGTICGGLARSELFIQTHSDILQIKIVKPHQTESVLLGAAMLGAAAAYYNSANVSSERCPD